MKCMIQTLDLRETGASRDESLISDHELLVPIETRFGSRVHTLRVERRLPQDILAARSHVHRNYISETERGKRNVSLRIIERIALALEVEIAELFRGKEFRPIITKRE